MLNYNDITERKFIEIDGQPFEVVSSNVFRMQKRKPVNVTKLKNLITGKVRERSFHHSDKVEEANIDTWPVKYLYTNKGEYWFCNPDDPSDRFQIPVDFLGDGIRFIKENTTLDALVFDDDIIGVKYPLKVALEVTEAPPNIKGNTSAGGDKVVTLETGTTITTPLFIEVGDIVRINTQTGQYSERVSK